MFDLYSNAVPLSARDAWRALLALGEGRDAQQLLDADEGPLDDLALTSEAAQLFALFLPILTARPERGPFVVAHLAQSLDGRIATRRGRSQWITGSEDITHCHRLRAVCDAVLVGAETAALDQPQLTVREVEGPDPLRVVIDPRRRLAPDCSLFVDGLAETLLICTGDGPEHIGDARVLTLPARGGAIEPRTIVEALGALGIRRLYIEGGGVTVSRFLAASYLNRLHLAVAPMLLGSGRPALQLPEVDTLAGSLRPPTACYPIGRDVLFDCALDG